VPGSGPARGGRCGAGPWALSAFSPTLTTSSHCAHMDPDAAHDGDDVLAHMTWDESAARDPRAGPCAALN
jgi:hypothetical protein